MEANRYDITISRRGSTEQRINAGYPFNRWCHRYTEIRYRGQRQISSQDNESQGLTERNPGDTQNGAQTLAEYSGRDKQHAQGSGSRGDEASQDTDSFA